MPYYYYGWIFLIGGQKSDDSFSFPSCSVQVPSSNSMDSAQYDAFSIISVQIPSAKMRHTVRN